jgi:hypothetical protein
MDAKGNYRECCIQVQVELMLLLGSNISDEYSATFFKVYVPLKLSYEP